MKFGIFALKRGLKAPQSLHSRSYSRNKELSLPARTRKLVGCKRLLTLFAFKTVSFMSSVGNSQKCNFNTKAFHVIFSFQPYKNCFSYRVVLTPSQSSNWGTSTCASRKSTSPCLLAIPAFDRIAGSIPGLSIDITRASFHTVGK